MEVRPLPGVAPCVREVVASADVLDVADASAAWAGVCPKGLKRPIHWPGASLGRPRRRPSSAPLHRSSPSTAPTSHLLVGAGVLRGAGDTPVSPSWPTWWG